MFCTYCFLRWLHFESLSAALGLVVVVVETEASTSQLQLRTAGRHLDMSTLLSTEVCSEHTQNTLYVTNNTSLQTPRCNADEPRRTITTISIAPLELASAAGRKHSRPVPYRSHTQRRLRHPSPSRRPSPCTAEDGLSCTTHATQRASSGVSYREECVLVHVVYRPANKILQQQTVHRQRGGSGATPRWRNDSHRVGSQRRPLQVIWTIWRIETFRRAWPGLVWMLTRTMRTRESALVHKIPHLLRRFQHTHARPSL